MHLIVFLVSPIHAVSNRGVFCSVRCFSSSPRCSGSFSGFAMADNAKLVAASASPPAQVAAPASPPTPVAALQTALLNVQRIASEMMEVPGALIDMPLALTVVAEALRNVVVMFQRATAETASLQAATTGLTFAVSSLQLSLQSGAVTHHDTVVAAALKAAAASFLVASSALEAEGADAMSIVSELLQSVADSLNALDVP